MTESIIEPWIDIKYEERMALLGIQEPVKRSCEHCSRTGRKYWYWHYREVIQVGSHSMLVRYTCELCKRVTERTEDLDKLLISKFDEEVPSPPMRSVNAKKWAQLRKVPRPQDRFRK